MPLITCPDCKTRISSDAPACPKCGRPITEAGRKEALAKEAASARQNRQVGWGCVAVFFAFALIVAGGVYLGESRGDSAPATSTSILDSPQMTRGGDPACLDKALESRAVELEGDAPALAGFLMQQPNGCVLLKPNLPVVVEDFAIGLVRIRPPGSPTSVWTVREALVPYDSTKAARSRRREK